MSGGLLIAEARKRAGLTQKELGDRLGSHQSVVARWEAGRASPDLPTIKRAVRAAGFDLSVAIHAQDDHDLTLIRRELRLKPHERLRALVDAVGAFANMSGAQSV